MEVSVALCSDFMAYFTGNKSGHGVHQYGIVPTNGKEENGKSFTASDPVTEELYKDHLNGGRGLGISPIDEKGYSSFGVIDVDIYNKTYDYIISLIYTHNLPLFPFRSKSGGLHIYMFLENKAKSRDLISVLREYCTILGLPNSTEIFPKQTSVSTGSIGNWINLPYYNWDTTNSFLIKGDGTRADLREALNLVADRRVDLKDAQDFIKILDLFDAPPCLQHIYLKRETKFRNEYLFSLARYYKTKFGDEFEQHLTTANNTLTMPVKVDELFKSVINSHRKKEYSYKCNQDPIISHCNKAICKKRKYGIGGDEISELSFEDFIQYETGDEPYYEWIINGKPLKFFSESDIIQQHKFRELCFRHLKVLPATLKPVAWTKIINGALTNMKVEKLDRGSDISPSTMLMDYLSEFLEKRAMAVTKEHILFDRVFKDDAKGQYVFKAKLLIDFLIRQKGFRTYGQVQIHDKLRTMGGAPVQYYVNKKNRACRVWVLPYNALDKFVEDETIDNFEPDFEETFDDKAF